MLSTAAYTPFLNLPSVVIRDFNGNFSANIIDANLSGSAAAFSGLLAGDVAGNQTATQVLQVGGRTAASIASAVDTVAGSTNLGLVNKIVMRDGYGDFTARIVTADLLGNARTASHAVTSDLIGSTNEQQLIAGINTIAQHTTAINGEIARALAAENNLLSNLSISVQALGSTYANITPTGALTASDSVLVAIKKLDSKVNTVSTSSNTSSGASSLASNTTGAYNAAGGYGSLSSNTTGSNNTAFGNLSLAQNKTGGNNTAFGSGADVHVDGLTNASAFGSNAIVNSSNTVQLGSLAITSVSTNNNCVMNACAFQTYTSTLTYQNGNDTIFSIAGSTTGGKLILSSVNSNGVISGEIIGTFMLPGNIGNATAYITLSESFNEKTVGFNIYPVPITSSNGTVIGFNFLANSTLSALHELLVWYYHIDYVQ